MQVIASRGLPGRDRAVGWWMALLGVAACGLAGCTVYPEQKTPTLMTTTSAEQVDRIFWQSVEQAKWTQVNALLAPNAIWRVDGRVVPRAEIVPWLQSLGIHAVQVSQVALTPAVNDMNLVYTVQIQADKAADPATAQSGANCAGQPQTLNALAVWQEPQPTGTPAKDQQGKKDKSYGGYLLTVHDLSVRSNAACH
jgi:hypothetical protein